MAIRQPGANIQKSFYVDRDDVRHHSRCAGSANSVHISWEQATKAGYEKLVAPNTLAVSYIETVLSSLIDLPLPGRTLEQKIRFTNPVYAADVILAKASISSWNADSGLMTVSVECRKEAGTLPVCAGTILLDLSK